MSITLNSVPVCFGRRRKTIRPTLQSATNQTIRPNRTATSLRRTAPTLPCLQWRPTSVDKDHSVAFPLRGSTCDFLFPSFHLLILPTVQCVEAGQLLETPSNKMQLLSVGVLLDHISSADILYLLLTHGLLKLPYFLTQQKSY